MNPNLLVGIYLIGIPVVILIKAILDSLSDDEEYTSEEFPEDSAGTPYWLVGIAWPIITAIVIVYSILGILSWLGEQTEKDLRNKRKNT